MVKPYVHVNPSYVKEKLRKRESGKSIGRKNKMNEKEIWD